MQTPNISQISPLKEKSIALKGISWTQFKTVESGLTDFRAARLTYLQGVLEIMSPISDDHETVKSTLGSLLEAYMRERAIRYYRRGGFTLQAEGYASGTPDESYSIGDRRQYPDIVIEVIITSGSISRTDLYLPLKIPEVWFWEAGKLRLFQLKETGYEEALVSQFFPSLAISLLEKYINQPDQYDAIQSFISEVQT